MRRLVPISLTLLALATTGVQFTAATFSNGSANPANALAASSDWFAPTVAASVVAKTAGGVAGTIKQGGAYYAYAQVTDSGGPASGIASVKANLSSITASQTAATLTAGSYSVGGTTYNYRSASITAKNPLAAGSVPYTVTPTDVAANTVIQTGFSVVVDNTAPTATDVQTTNAAGGIAGRPEAGDTLTLTFSKPIDPNSVLGAWSGADTSVVVRITNGGTGNDVLTIRNAANAAQLPLGSIALGRIDYVTTTVNFGATATASQMRQVGNTIVLTLGTPSAAGTTAAAAAPIVWTPAAGATDAAGNATSTAAVTETGAADLDF
ncbi:MAG TPA: hypothetical protein VEX36_02265 [Thermoleophilaceae bacterium]|nr:hypothetical protein [Thermoleophilaceae bacterium]